MHQGLHFREQCTVEKPAGASNAMLFVKLNTVGYTARIFHTSMGLRSTYPVTNSLKSLDCSGTQFAICYREINNIQGTPLTLGVKVGVVHRVGRAGGVAGSGN